MASKFRIGATAYTSDGRRYFVDEVEDGIVYCSSPSGAETEFPEARLMTEAEWAKRADAKRLDLYPRLKQAPAYTRAPRLDRAAAEQVLLKVERLEPGMLDFVAYEAARNILVEAGEQDLVEGLSIVKCRAVFDSAEPAVRAGLLAQTMGVAADVLVGAARLGDNLMRAMVAKGLGDREDAFEAFRNRRRG
ncbi:hypothetical protein GCM10011611_19950 [Aliidongia dinghuensis]|uniref:Uncharacterized protein n=1 Tax=Aliidongia dinghuensis TaxID=1867774 RepID=A0A8J3E1Q4_9PROT|nr:hypothetical protein [Aliidongia dinghuensis]GGF14218.1 hypothetical protein GCM10011611_19950 [Aliidongia dinghuensis]